MIQRVGIVAKIRLLAASGPLVEIAEWLDHRGIEPVFEVETAALAGFGGERIRVSRDELADVVDLVLVLGGDGTLLSMADRIGQAGRDIPILGVNFGHLGFLTEISLSDLFPALESALAGSALIDERLMLQCRIVRRGKTFAERILLNDVVVERGAMSRMLELSVSVGGQFVARFHADGLIIASPTGSTAYNLSAAGPIVHPEVDALVLTPIAPHTLTNRPVVIPASQEVTIQPLAHNDGHEVFVTFDGQSGLQLQADDVVMVRKAEARLRMVRAPRTYFQVLRQKLKWAER